VFFREIAMSSPTSAGGQPGSKADLDTLKADVTALREDLATLLRDTGSLASAQARAAAARAQKMAGDAGEKAIEFRDAVGDKVRQHPFAALGIALATGFIIASLSRRN
jgi:ElaB/YqjD/DUF883 family membrane-anchored ribosome-binding protein